MTTNTTACKRAGALLAAALAWATTARAQAPAIVGEGRAYAAESPHPYPADAGRRLPGTPAKVWTDEITSPGATFLRLHFSRFDLAPGDYLLVSSRDGSTSWRYTGRGPNGTGEFWAFAVPGDGARVEILAATGGRHGYTIDRLGHGTVDVFGGADTAPARVPKSICGADGKEDVACHPELAPLYSPVARLLFATSGGGQALCTGWLVTGSNANTLMTNNHCVSNQAGVSSVQALFNFQNTSCGGSTVGATSSFAGGTFLRTSPVNGGLDYTLMTLQGNPAATFGRLTPSATNAPVGRQIVIVQHPGGRVKQVGFYEDPGHTTLCRITGTSGTQTRYNCDTEGGSSGSPVIDATTGRVVGLHHFGGCPNSASQIVPICNDAGSLLSCGGATAVATLHQHCSFGGWSAAFTGAGSFNAADIVSRGGVNNDASSIRIAPGFRATLFDGDGQTGRSIVLASDDACFVDDGFNDVLSSMRIEPDTGGGGVVFFEHINFGGAAGQPLAPGSYTLAQLQAGGISNDWASSVRIPAGTTVTLYQHDNFGGTAWTLTSDTADFRSLSPNANDQMSSCRIQ